MVQTDGSRFPLEAKPCPEFLKFHAVHAILSADEAALQQELGVVEAAVQHRGVERRAARTVPGVERRAEPVASWSRTELNGVSNSTPKCRGLVY